MSSQFGLSTFDSRVPNGRFLYLLLRRVQWHTLSALHNPSSASAARGIHNLDFPTHSSGSRQTYIATWQNAQRSLWLYEVERTGAGARSTFAAPSGVATIVVSSRMRFNLWILGMQMLTTLDCRNHSIQRVWIGPRWNLEVFACVTA